MRWSICEGELIQAMGRGRGVNRTAATPLEIDLLTDVVLPVTVDALVPWSDLRPTRRDLMAPYRHRARERRRHGGLLPGALVLGRRSPAGSVEEV